MQTVERAFSTLTDHDGNWQLTVTEGTYTVRFSRKDYLDTTVPNVVVQPTQSPAP